MNQVLLWIIFVTEDFISKQQNGEKRQQSEKKMYIIKCNSIRNTVKGF